MTYTVRKLIEQREALDAEIAALQAEMYLEKLAEARLLIEEFGFTAYELGLVKTQQITKRGRKPAGTFQPRIVRGPQPPRYRDPATGQTWSGFGRPPSWMDGDRDDYLIAS